MALSKGPITLNLFEKISERSQNLVWDLLYEDSSCFPGDNCAIYLLNPYTVGKM